jgi:hypothetical protein
MRRRLPLISLAGSVILLAACGGTSSSTSQSASKPSAEAAWAASTQQLCQQKKAAIANLGGVDINYAGIARLGLPAVKRSLDRYLDRLLAVLRSFAQRQQQLATPPRFISTMGTAAEIDAETQAATAGLRTEVADATSAGELSAAFRGWTSTLAQLSAQSSAVMARVHLPACSA